MRPVPPVPRRPHRSAFAAGGRGFLYLALAMFLGVATIVLFVKDSGITTVEHDGVTCFQSSTGGLDCDFEGARR